MTTAFDMLTAVKTALGISTSFSDSVIQVYINEVNEYLLSAGLPESSINSETTVGVVARGVSDLWNYGGGTGVLSPYFHERVVQLTVGGTEDD